MHVQGIRLPAVIMGATAATAIGVLLYLAFHIDRERSPSALIFSTLLAAIAYFLGGLKAASIAPASAVQNATAAGVALVLVEGAALAVLGVPNASSWFAILLSWCVSVPTFALAGFLFARSWRAFPVDQVSRDENERRFHLQVHAPCFAELSLLVSTDFAPLTGLVADLFLWRIAKRDRFSIWSEWWNVSRARNALSDVTLAGKLNDLLALLSASAELAPARLRIREGRVSVLIPKASWLRNYDSEALAAAVSRKLELLRGAA